jgi:hypothetical protein
VAQRLRAVVIARVGECISERVPSMVTKRHTSSSMPTILIEISGSSSDNEALSKFGVFGAHVGL